MFIYFRACSSTLLTNTEICVSPTLVRVNEAPVIQVSLTHFGGGDLWSGIKAVFFCSYLHSSGKHCPLWVSVHYCSFPICILWPQSFPDLAVEGMASVLVSITRMAVYVMEQNIFFKSKGQLSCLEGNVGTHQSLLCRNAGCGCVCPRR